MTAYCVFSQNLFSKSRHKHSIIFLKRVFYVYGWNVVVMQINDASSNYTKDDGDDDDNDYDGDDKGDNDDGDDIYIMMQCLFVCHEK